ncbi:hypothetical protein Runsl_2877 [Runella slithyformis DSM 19594]|uniref:Uncharacterized protein n=1 Tax=Runella slithyformis (strain ATCC 29530 / DSM 19594 / LMG 11500 / NCIMB 11436 / LSU 4) TaxID=761193 RepID=A0A7U3ZL77_RUNSL|nr:hypothetical protein Runsl_2877 [Runella slithyformis DSM 19594]
MLQSHQKIPLRPLAYPEVCNNVRSFKKTANDSSPSFFLKVLSQKAIFKRAHVLHLLPGKSIY